MATRGFLRRILVLGERQTLKDLRIYSDMAKESTELLISQLSSISEDTHEIPLKIRQLEKKGDKLTMGIKTEITQGAINSTLLGHLLSLVDISDDFLDRCLYISREIERMSHYLCKNDASRNYVRQHIYPKFVEMLKINIEGLDHLRSMLGEKSVSDMREHRIAIQHCEEEVDDLKDNILDGLYVEADNHPYVVFVHVSNTVHRIDDLLDDCEDASDLVITISTSVSR